MGRHIFICLDELCKNSKKSKRTPSEERDGVRESEIDHENCWNNVLATNLIQILSLKGHPKFMFLIIVFLSISIS